MAEEQVLNTHNAEILLSAANKSHYPQDDLPEVALAGRSNVGKSSFINTLLGRKNLLLMNSVNGFVVSLSSWMLIVFLNHFHYFIQVSLNSVSNIIISMVEIIFIIFASNKVFLSTHWLPIALPFNSLILSDWSQLNSLPLWIVGVTLLFICLIDYRTKK